MQTTVSTVSEFIPSIGAEAITRQQEATLEGVPVSRVFYEYSAGQYNRITRVNEPLLDSTYYYLKVATGVQKQWAAIADETGAMNQWSYGEAELSLEQYLEPNVTGTLVWERPVLGGFSGGQSYLQPYPETIDFRIELGDSAAFKIETDAPSFQVFLDNGVSLVELGITDEYISSEAVAVVKLTTTTLVPTTLTVTFVGEVVQVIPVVSEETIQEELEHPEGISVENTLLPPGKAFDATFSNSIPCGHYNGERGETNLTLVTPPL